MFVVPLLFIPCSLLSRCRQRAFLPASKRGEWENSDDWETLSRMERDKLDSNGDTFDFSNVGYIFDKYVDDNDDDNFEVDSSLIEYVNVDELESLIDDIFMMNYEGITLYDTAKDTYNQYANSDMYLEDATRDIARLIRCNEEPESAVLGNHLKALTDDERYSNDFLLDAVTGNPTEFFFDSVQKIFYEHSTMKNKTQVLDGHGISRWMSKSLDQHLTKYDSRVYMVLSKFGYGAGFLSKENFYALYLDAVMNKQLRKQPNIRSVWRDFRAHGIVSPIESQRAAIEKEINESLRKNGHSEERNQLLLDECEILTWDVDNESIHDSSSYERVKVSKIDGKTPLYMKDGEFVLIDEESCIGCAQCAQIAPNSFMILPGSGRARTFSQSNDPSVKTAVELCPVTCMHNVAFHELKEFEAARDKVSFNRKHKSVLLLVGK